MIGRDLHWKKSHLREIHVRSLLREMKNKRQNVNPFSLFKTSELPQPGMYSVSTSPNPMSTTLGQHSIKLSCDRHLLTAAHNKNVAVAAVLAVLKGILVFADATAQKTSQSSGKKSGLNTPVHPGSTPKSGSGDLSQILGTSDMGILGVGDEPMLDLQ